MQRPGQCVMVVAGEASGDAHAAALVEHLKKLRPDVTFFGMGGSALAAQGVELTHSSSELSVMGIVEVLPKLRRILAVMDELVAVAAERKPTVAVLVDAADFNLRLAPKLKAIGVKVVQYVSPTVWAWREGRTKQLAKSLEELLCILPFEETFLRERGVNATYVGSPVLDHLPAERDASFFRTKLGLSSAKRTLAILPGSRKAELARLGAVMAEVARRVAAEAPTQFVVPVAPGLDEALVRAPFEGLDVTYVQGQAAACVGASDVALVASGTASLEAGLMERPLVCIYRVAPVTYAVGKVMVRNLRHFCLINLLADARVVPELLQGDATADKILKALTPLWAGPVRDRTIAQLAAVAKTLGAPGASRRAAERVATHLD